MSSNNEKIIATLHPFERIVLPLLKKIKIFSELVPKSNLKDVEVMRALEWLENKRIISTEKKETSFVHLGENGKRYKEQGLPERRILIAIKD